MSEVYKSTTHGPIPLSFTGRRLLANEREAATTAIAAGDFNADDRALSKARGELAKYMSSLEGKKAPKDEVLFIGIDYASIEARVLAAMYGGMSITGRWSSAQAAEDHRQRERSYIAQLERKCCDLIHELGPLKADNTRPQAQLRAAGYENARLKDKIAELDKLSDSLVAAHQQEIAALKLQVNEAFGAAYIASGWMDGVRKVLRSWHNKINIDGRKLDENG